MRAQIALALRLALLALSVAAAAPPLQRDELYVLPLSPYGSDTALLAPALSLGGGTPLAVGPASEPQACALACQANPACSWFNFRPCSEQVGGCFGSGTSREGEGAGFARGVRPRLSPCPPLSRRDARAASASSGRATAPSRRPSPSAAGRQSRVRRLGVDVGRWMLMGTLRREWQPASRSEQAAGGMQAPLARSAQAEQTRGTAASAAHAAAGAVAAHATHMHPHAPTAPTCTPPGFPVREPPLELPGFTSRAAEGVDGSDFPCSGSVMPGACAFESALDAAAVCSTLPECRAVVVYSNGRCMGAWHLLVCTRACLRVVPGPAALASPPPPRPLPRCRAAQAPTAAPPQRWGCSSAPGSRQPTSSSRRPSTPWKSLKTRPRCAAGKAGGGQQAASRGCPRPLNRRQPILPLVRSVAGCPARPGPLPLVLGAARHQRGMCVWGRAVVSLPLRRIRSTSSEERPRSCCPPPPPPPPPRRPLPAPRKR